MLLDRLFTDPFRRCWLFLYARCMPKRFERLGRTLAPPSPNYVPEGSNVQLQRINLDRLLTSLRKLLRRFFSLYASLDESAGVVSVRTGALQPRPGSAGAQLQPDATHPELSCAHALAIEDPFELSRDLGDTLTDATCAITRAELQRAHALLSERNNRAAAAVRGAGDAPAPWAQTLGELLMPRI